MPYRSCPSFDTCACNDCPLDASSALRGGHRVGLPGEQTCNATRATRERLAVAYGIDPRLVLLPRERRSDDARRRWEQLPPAVKARVLASGAGMRYGASGAPGGPSPRPRAGAPARTAPAPFSAWERAS